MAHLTVYTETVTDMLFPKYFWHIFEIGASDTPCSHAFSSCLLHIYTYAPGMSCQHVEMQY